MCKGPVGLGANLNLTFDIYFFIAIQEISTLTFSGNLDTSTVSLAGVSPLKLFHIPN